MALRELGRSGLMTPPLILGGNVFGWTADEAAGMAVLDSFVAAGGRMIDTADKYSTWVPGHIGGESEAAIGRWLKARRLGGQVMITTKVGMMGEGLRPAHIAAAAEGSLRRLGVECIDLYLAHQDDENTPQETVAEAFDALVRAGKVRAIGASNFTAERFAGALDTAQAQGCARYQVLQPHYNLMERAAFEGPLQSLCLAYGIGVTPYYSLASGFLTGKYRNAIDLGKSARGDGAGRYLDTRGLAVLAALDSVAEETGASLAAIALAWLAHQPAVAAPIASATTAAQMEELAAAMHLTLSADQLARLDTASA
jgi:aryl-alcohol dehydrogenase-like predicted oxidoreductase